MKTRAGIGAGVAYFSIFLFRRETVEKLVQGELPLAKFDDKLCQPLGIPFHDRTLQCCEYTEYVLLLDIILGRDRLKLANESLGGFECHQQSLVKHAVSLRRSTGSQVREFNLHKLEHNNNTKVKHQKSPISRAFLLISPDFSYFRASAIVVATFGGTIA